MLPVEIVEACKAASGAACKDLLNLELESFNFFLSIKYLPYFYSTV